MKKLLMIITILLSFIVIGCENEETRIEFSTDNIVMEINSTYKIKYKTYGNVKDISFNVLDNMIATVDNNIITAHKPGDTKLICTYNKVKEIEINIKVLNTGQEFLEIGDPRLNELNYNSLKNEIATFSNVLNQSEYLSIDMKVKIDDEESNQILKAKENPLYIEIIDEDYTSIIAQEENKVFQYTINDDNEEIDRTYLGLLGSNDYDDFEDVDYSDELLETKFDGEKCNVQYINDTYILKCYYSDAINEESKKSIKEYYGILGIPTSILFNAIITMKYVVYDEKLYMSISTTIVDKNLPNGKLTMEISYEIELKEFTPKDMLNSGYIFSNAKNFEEVLGIYDFDRDINLNSKPVYLKVEVERGVIAARAEYVGFELYDMDKQLVCESFDGSDLATLSHINVPQKGTYYLVIKNRYGDAKRIDLNFYPYDSVYSEEGIDLKSNNSYQGVIEGEYDFEKFIYNNKTNEWINLNFQNTGNASIKLFNKRNWDMETIMTIAPNSYKFIELAPGENEIYICEDFKSYSVDKGYEYSFEANITYLPKDANIVKSEIPAKFNLPSNTNRYYYTYLEVGMYSIKNEENRYDTHSVVLCDQSGSKLNKHLDKYYPYVGGLSNYFSISKDGYYYVGIINKSSSRIPLFFEKHIYESIEGKDNPHVLEPTSEIELEGRLDLSKNFDYYYLNNDTQKTKIYSITNETEQSIRIVFKRYKTDTINDKIIMPGIVEFFASYPGQMEFFVVLNNRYGNNNNLDYRIKFKEIENNNITDKDSPDIKEITNEFSEEHYIVGYSLAPAYFILNVEEKGLVTFEFESEYIKSNLISIQPTILDENGKKIAKDSLLEPGKYYVRFATNDNLIYIAKVKYTLHTLDDKDVYIDLEEIDNSANDIYNEKISDDQVVRYHFTLDEKTTIYYDAYYVNIYHENGKLASLPLHTSISNRKIYIDLEPGNYYFETPNYPGDASGNKKTIFIGIKSLERDAPQDFSNMISLEFNQFYQFSKNYTSDLEFVKINIETDGEYTCLVSNGTGYLYNENHELIDTLDRSTSKKIYFEKGTYYLVAAYPSSGETPIKIKISN